MRERAPANQDINSHTPLPRRLISRTEYKEQFRHDTLKDGTASLHRGSPGSSGLKEILMSSERDESLVLELLDDAVTRLRAMVGLIIDAEATAHAAMAELEQMRDARPDADATTSIEERELELQRAISLATGTATMLQALLDEVAAWIAELEGHRGTPKS
jgi:hypothetical protein